MIITIDGPAGAGKTTTARAVAQALGFALIQTGAMYRAVALAAHQAGLDAARDGEAIGNLARQLDLGLRPDGHLTLQGQDIADQLQTAQISEAASQVALMGPVREALVEVQRRLGHEGEARQGGAVLEGRDAGTVIFPQADLKIFLTADLEVRARRRWLERRPQGQEGRPEGQQADARQTRREIARRDARDSERALAPLRAAEDAIEVNTDGLNAQEVCARIVELAHNHHPASTGPVT